MPDLIANLMLASALVGGFIGWQLRSLLAERAEYRAEEERDRARDAARRSGGPHG